MTFHSMPCARDLFLNAERPRILQPNAVGRSSSVSTSIHISFSFTPSSTSYFFLFILTVTVVQKSCLGFVFVLYHTICTIFSTPPFTTCQLYRYQHLPSQWHQIVVPQLAVPTPPCLAPHTVLQDLKHLNWVLYQPLHPSQQALQSHLQRHHSHPSKTVCHPQ